MHVLITGGAGFVGSHLAEALLRQGNNVTVLDDLSTGSILTIQHLKRERRFVYVIDSVMHRAVLAEFEGDVGGVAFHPTNATSSTTWPLQLVFVWSWILRCAPCTPTFAPLNSCWRPQRKRKRRY